MQKNSLIETLQDIAFLKREFPELLSKPTCYQCDEQCNYLFADGRCYKCTRLSVDEVHGGQ